MLWRGDSTKTLGDLPTFLLEHTLAQFGQAAGSGPVSEVLRSEEQRFAGLLTCGRKVLTEFISGRPRLRTTSGTSTRRTACHLSW